jgi:SPP1 family phage portal protein
MKTYGRITIQAPYTEKQFLSGTDEDILNKIYDILNNSAEIHRKNRDESKYLQDYLYGDQDIKDKIKLTRTDINNKSVENWAWAFQDWKNAFLLGKPIQYAPLNDVANDEISKLNSYVNYEGKSKKDQDLFEDMFTCGRGYRYNVGSKITDEDEAPFDIVNLDVLNTEVVYSNSIYHEQLLAYVHTDMMYIVSEVNPETGKPEQRQVNYDEYTVYTRNMQYTINNKSGSFKIADGTEPNPIPYNTHIVTEYYFNKKRVSMLELVKDILDDLNDVENFDKDDIESFVNSIMVFTNAEVNKEGMEAIKEYGAVSIKSTDQKKASVELLQSRLKSLDTQIYYLRKLSALHSILSVPEATQSGEISNAETGKAVLTGQGFTSASVRIQNEENSFKECDRRSLKVILKICRESSNSEIKSLKASDIDIKFSRDLSDNLLTKTTALLNLASAQIPPEVRNAVVNLFSDPLSVTKMQEAYMEEQRKINQELQTRNTNNNENKINENANKMQDNTQIENQEQ